MAGFDQVSIVKETGFNSSDATKGILLKAVKPATGVSQRRSDSMFDKYQEFFNEAYSDGVIDRKTKHLIALGASLGAGCDP
jgi:alkylhydroperoxidase/carboxymuconolactone decarboxylase family protein YurZ